VGRRSDRSRTELETLIVAEAHRHLAEVGYARFSAREVAKRIGYSVGSLYHVFGTLDALLVAVNARTLDLWADALETALLDVPAPGRIDALVRAYFAFARGHHNSWSAIYDFRAAPDVPPSDAYARALDRLIGLVDREVEATLPPARKPAARALARSLLATVHGHCAFALNGTFAQLGIDQPVEETLLRIREALDARSTAPIAS
jgi:AcrR family transcriptional regulator